MFLVVSDEVIPILVIFLFYETIYIYFNTILLVRVLLPNIFVRYLIRKDNLAVVLFILLSFVFCQIGLRN